MPSIFGVFRLITSHPVSVEQFYTRARVEIGFNLNLLNLWSFTRLARCMLRESHLRNPLLWEVSL
jgi:hypothetical protein